jgi:hypothetical protein
MFQKEGIESCGEPMAGVYLHCLSSDDTAPAHYVVHRPLMGIRMPQMSHMIRVASMPLASPETSFAISLPCRVEEQLL